MLVLVIPQFFFFFFFLNLRIHNIIPAVIKRLFLNKLAGFSKVSRNPIPRLVSVRVETETVAACHAI